VLGPEAVAAATGNETVNDGCESGCIVSPPFCGNGVETRDEECDDGNAVNDDGCDTDCVASCPAAPGQGSCASEVASSLQIRDSADDTRDTVVWKWKGDPPSSLFDPYYGDGEFQVCLYPDGGSLGGAVRLRGRPGWTSRFSSADVRVWTYTDRDLERSGLRRAKLEVDSGFEPESKLKLKAQGVDLPDGLLPASSSFSIEFHDGVNCWSSTFFDGTLKDDSFKATYRLP
jgi:cysteine-rich repeat protein